MSGKDTSLLTILLNDASFENWARNRNQNDVAFWNQWISENQDKIETVYNAKEIILGISFCESTIGIDKVNRELEGVLGQLSIKNKTIPQRKKAKTPFKRYLAAAAIGLVFVLLGYSSFISPSAVTHKTAYGEIIDLKLPDGTSVVLNGNSEISYTKNNSRDINLVGEAYFKVKPIPSKNAKFWVNTKDLRVEVFGTHFHVNTREEKTDVLLDEGSIALTLNNGNKQKMVPGELFTFSKKNNSVLHKKVTRELSYSFWKEGTYVFNNTSMAEVMKNVEYAHGIPAEFIDEQLKKVVLTGGIPNHNLKICLSAIEKATGTRIVKKDNTLLIFKN